MGFGIILMMCGIFILIMSATLAKVIMFQKPETWRLKEKGLRVIIMVFAGIIILLGFLITFEIVSWLFLGDPDQMPKSGLFCLAFGILSVVGGPFVAKYMVRASKDNGSIQVVGIRGLIFLYWGIGAIMIAAGIFMMTGLFLR